MAILGSLDHGHLKGRFYKEFGFVPKLRNNEARADEDVSAGEEGQLRASRCILRRAIKRPRRSSVMSEPSSADVVMALSLHKLVLIKSLRRCKGRFLRRRMTKRRAKPEPRGGAAVRGPDRLFHISPQLL